MSLNVGIMLYLRRADRSDHLAAELGDLLSAPLDDPFDREVVAVPTRGVERWLIQTLSGRLGATDALDGVCANIDFPFPESLIRIALAVGGEFDAESDPWQPDRLVWSLFEAVLESRGETWLTPLAQRVRVAKARDEAAAADRGCAGVSPGAEGSPGWYGPLRHVADLFDRYAVHRPSMVRHWLEGSDVDGSGRDLGADARWQPELWRRTRRQVGVTSPPERLDAACALIESDPGLIDLPERISLFGLTRLPATYMRVLTSIAACRDVHLYLLHPSEALWRAVDSGDPGTPKQLGTPRRPGTPRRSPERPPARRGDDSTARYCNNPLLASWGRDAREMQLVVSTPTAESFDVGRRSREVATLLGRIQADIRANRAPAGRSTNGADQRRIVTSDDRSIQIHACHGRSRQVEVLRDAILGILADDSSIEPRDIVVMCPDVEAFAPIIEATFGAEVAATEGVGDLRIRLADRSIRQTNPIATVVSDLLELIGTRLTLADIIDVAAREPVKRRFRFADDELDTIERWATDAGVRWGLDSDFRMPFRLGNLDANTWRAGLDRLLLGVAMADEEERVFGGVVPLDDVDSGSIDLAGRFAEFVDRIGSVVRSWAQPHPIADWVDAILDGVGALTLTNDRDSWQHNEFERLLHSALDEATFGGRVSNAILGTGDMRSLLNGRLRGRPTRANFRTGHVTVCTLHPMRSVPQRVVCLIGLDDGAYPRRNVIDGDDLVAQDPHVGDRDLRSEDRQLLLDALMAAQDHLVITYEGRDERTNAVRPPAVPVGELIDAIDRTACFEDDDADGGLAPASRRVVLDHPLHSFDERNFELDGISEGRIWSFSRIALDGAQARRGRRSGVAPFLESPLDAPGDRMIEIDELIRFVQHPVRAFLRSRLGVTLQDQTDRTFDSLPVQPDGLEKWSTGQRLVDAVLEGVPLRRGIIAERARGTLPPGPLANVMIGEMVPEIEAIANAVGELRRAGRGVPDGPIFDVDIEVGRRRLVGTVGGYFDGLILAVGYSRVGPKQRLAAWIRFLVMSASDAEDVARVVTVGRAPYGVRNKRVRIATLDPAALGADPRSRRDRARERLADVLAIYEDGMRAPLPLYCKTSAAYAERGGGERGLRDARKAWNSTKYVPGEDADLSHRLVLGGIVDFDDVAAVDAPTPSTERDGRQVGGAHTFESVAQRIWYPILECEQVIDR